MILKSSLVPTERIRVLDQLRGFALLTIFLVNLNQLGGINASYLLVESGAGMSVSDRLNHALHIIFGDSSRPLFAFMFGITMVLMYDRARSKLKNPYWILIRRMVILLVIGALHYRFIWDGDILFMYALDGFLLLLFVSMSAWPLFLFGVLAIFLSQPSPIPVFLFINGTTTELWGYLLNDAPHFFLFKPIAWLHPNFAIEFSRAAQHLSFFLFGMAAYRSRLFELKHGWWTGLVSLIFLLIGLWGKYQLKTNLNFDWIHLSFFWNFSVSLGLVFAFLFFSSSRIFSFVSAKFTWIGRMTLTHYLLQSIVFVSVFIGAGITPLNRIAFVQPFPFSILLLIGVIFFAVQMWVSKLWLNRFDYGPCEWLWRIGTHWKLTPIRRKKRKGKVLCSFE